ncbi:hypothetical protein [Leclercia adecarboxylata]|uniref:hypothetical protein n=1 Tax=Leclercia adecarboxylata TaxID=83655 RepID=UPI001F3595C2|nr:hypothetical protein [Leclercia adecarboxylata]MCE9977301.1 hypothetical protein [Leclercia adecarboxylata]
MAILPPTFERWAEVLRDGIGEREMTMGSALLANQERQLHALARQARFTILFGKPAAVVNSALLHSELGHLLATMGSAWKTESMVTPVFATPILTTSWLA